MKMDGKYEVKRIGAKEKERLMRKYHSKVYELKASINGTCVKLFTDDRQFKRMWEENFEQMPEWIRPHARLFAVKENKGKLEVLYEPLSKTAIVKNCSYYGWIKSIALALVADFMEDFTSEHRRQSVHGSFIDKGGRGMAIIGPPGSGKTTLTYGLLLDRQFNFLTDDWFFVRFAKKEIRISSSERNSYVRKDLAENWPELKEKMTVLASDKNERAIVDVKGLFGPNRIKRISRLSLIILLTREKGKPYLQKLDKRKAMEFMLKHDFCNPHQLIRSKAKKEQRKQFFNELFDSVPVYLLNTIELPEESLKRLRGLAGQHLK